MKSSWSNLDVTLLRRAILAESFWSVLSHDRRSIFRSVGEIRKGPAFLNRHLAIAARIDPATLPYDPEVISYVKAWRDAGGRAALVTATDETIARGNGRAYGDSAINPEATLETRHFDHMLAFDAETGRLIAEAGVILGGIIAAFLPRGWFPCVTPGTRFVTLGGMIAADVHGKNHNKELMQAWLHFIPAESLWIH